MRRKIRCHSVMGGLKMPISWVALRGAAMATLLGGLGGCVGIVEPETGDEPQGAAPGEASGEASEGPQLTRVISALTTVNGIGANGLGGNGINLNGINLNGINLNGINLNGINLNGINLNGINLNGINLNGLIMNGINLNGSNHNGINLNCINLHGINLIHNN